MSTFSAGTDGEDYSFSKDRWNGTSLFLNSSLFKRLTREPNEVTAKSGAEALSAWGIYSSTKGSRFLLHFTSNVKYVNTKRGLLFNPWKVLENVVIPFMSQMCLFLLPFFIFFIFLFYNLTITVVTLQIQVNSLKNAQLVIVDPRIKMGI